MTDINSMPFLEDINCLLSKYESNKSNNKKKFNIFNVMKVETDEVKTHSAIISELLNPKGSHKYGDKFLKIFLEIIDELHPDFNFSKNEDLKETLVLCEKNIGKISSNRTEGGRIDILLEHPKYILCIENKINADDEDFQLRRYHNFLLESNKKSVLLYLSVHGKDADIKSICNSELIDKKWISNINEKLILKKDYFCISYGNDIIDWLNDCYKIVSQDNTCFSKTLEQYINLINQLTTTMTIDEEQELMDILGKNKNILSAKYIGENWNLILYLIRQYFWHDLIKIDEKSNGKLKLLDIENCQELINQSLEDIHKTTELKFLLQDFIIPNLYISIKEHEGKIIYGIGCKDSNDLKSISLKSENLYNHIRDFDYQFVKGDDLFAYKNFNLDIDFVNMNDFTLSMANPNNRLKIIEDILIELNAFIYNLSTRIENYA